MLDTSCGLRVAGCGLPAAGYWLLGSARCKVKGMRYRADNKKRLLIAQDEKMGL